MLNSRIDIDIIDVYWPIFSLLIESFMHKMNLCLLLAISVFTWNVESRFAAQS